MLVPAFARIDLGDLPEWLGLLGGVAAVGSWWLRRTADKVGIYAIASRWSRSTSGADDFTSYKVVNGGQYPLRDVEVSVWSQGNRRRLWRALKPARWFSGERLGGRWHHVVEPGQCVESNEGDELPAPRLDGPPAKDHLTPAPDLLLTFYDGKGNRWVRWPNGKLNRIYAWQRR